MIKLKSQQETGAWLACLQAAASGRGLATEITPYDASGLAELADSLYASLTARTELAPSDEVVAPAYVGADCGPNSDGRS